MTGVDLDERTNGHTDEVVEITFDDLLESLDYGDNEVPTETEAVAIASAISSHLTDQARAMLAAEAETTETVSQWTLSGRLDRVNAPARRRPRSVERGREWQAAARTL